MASFSPVLWSADPAGPGVPTVGVEEEFLLADLSTGHLLPISAHVVEVAGDLGGALELELTRAQVEINTPVCRTMAEVREQLTFLRSTAAEAASRCGGNLLAVGTALADDAPGPPITDDPRYHRINKGYGQLAPENVVCGCHVHVEVPDRETAVQVCNHVRPWLPVLLALTANSPIHHGVDTDYASWRSVIVGRWPCAGAPPYFESLAHYEAAVEMAVGSGSVLDEKMVYWDVRPSSHLPTVEVRVSDVQSTVDEAVLFAALVRALVMTSLQSIQDGVEAPRVSDDALRMAYWRAARDGLDGMGVDLDTIRPVPAVDLLHRLLHHVEPALTKTGDLQAVKTLVDELVTNGNGASRQRRVFRHDHAVTDVVALVAQRAEHDRSPDNVG